jgi:hypothetical protein
MRGALPPVCDDGEWLADGAVLRDHEREAAAQAIVEIVTR